jgi:hypothetical protein
MIDITKPIRTKSGEPVEIISDSGRKPFTLVGYAGVRRTTTVWHADGKMNGPNSQSSFDLENYGSEPQWVPLGPEDVPPGSVFSAFLNTPGYCYPSLVDEDGCFFASRPSQEVVSWEDLFDHWQIKRPGEDWKPCKKEAQP